MDLLKNIAVERIKVGVVAGTSDITSDAIDMAGWDGVVIIAAFGALTAGQVTKMKLQQSSDDAAADAYADLAGTLTASLADGDSDKLIAVDLNRPKERYIKAIIDRGTQNAVCDGIFAIKYRGSKSPFTQGSDVAISATHISPAEGTA